MANNPDPLMIEKDQFLNDLFSLSSPIGILRAGKKAQAKNNTKTNMVPTN